MTSTQTAKSRARIWPPATFQTEVESTIRQVKPKLEILWDGMIWTDESIYFLSAQGDSALGGIIGENMASQIDIEVDNTSKRFTSGSGSPIDSYLKPRAKMRLSVSFGDTSYYMRLFTGYIKAISPNRMTGICNLHCFDNTQYILNKPAGRKLYTDKRSDELIEILALEAGLSTDDYDLDIGEAIIPVCWVGDRYVNPMMSDIAVAERGRVFFDESGILRFWNRTRLHSLPPLTTLTLTYDNWLKNVNYGIAEQNIKNRCTVLAKPRASAGVQVVWTNGDVQALSPYTDTLVWIPALGTQYAFIQLEDPCDPYIEPVATTDYTANTAADGSGDDKTAFISISEWSPHDDTVFLGVSNNSTTDVYLTKFQIRANPLKVWRWIRVRYKDEYSISLYGEQEINIENDLITDEGLASEMVYEEVSRRRDGKNRYTADIIGIPYLRCGDVVNVEMDTGDTTSNMIDKLDWTLDENGFIQTLTFIAPYSIPQTVNIQARAKIS